MRAHVAATPCTQRLKLALQTVVRVVELDISNTGAPMDASTHKSATLPVLSNHEYARESFGQSWPMKSEFGGFWLNAFSAPDTAMHAHADEHGAIYRNSRNYRLL